MNTTQNNAIYNTKEIKDFGDLNEYISNKEMVLGILNKAKFSIKGNGIRGNDYKYILEISMNNKSFEFDYFEGCGNKILNEENGLNKIISCLWCLLSDYGCTGYSLTEFMEEFGYDSLAESKPIYNKILENNKKLIQIFSEEEIDLLKENIDL